jgi:integral membrane protein
MMPGRTLRLLALAEAATLLALLFVAVPLKHFMGIAEVSRVAGPVHGLIFLAFCWVVIQAWSEGVIARRDAARLFIGACLPFGGIVNERWLRAKLARGRE